MVYTRCKICNSETADFLVQFELIKCSRCSLIFYKHPLPSAYAKDLYNQLYNKGEDYAAYKQEATLLQQGIQPHLGYNKQKILNSLIKKRCRNFVEIGAGVGITGNYLQNQKLIYNGIELDAEAVRLANSAGINVTNHSFEYLSAFTNKDAAVAFEVLEHIDDIGECFKHLYNCLKPGGYLGFSVPNFNNFYNLSAAAQQTGLGQVSPPVHINFFTVENLQKIVQLSGFTPLYLRPRPYPTLLLRKKATYKKLWRSLLGKYEGSTILCVARRNA